MQVQGHGKSDTANARTWFTRCPSDVVAYHSADQSEGFPVVVGKGAQPVTLAALKPGLCIVADPGRLLS